MRPLKEQTRHGRIIERITFDTKQTVLGSLTAVTDCGYNRYSSPENTARWRHHVSDLCHYRKTASF